MTLKNKVFSHLKYVLCCLVMFYMVLGTSISVFAAQDVKYIAHRGDMTEAPEESYAAIDKAVENGYHAIECDVWKTKSKNYLIFHDKNLKRLCGVDKPIWSVSAKTRTYYPFLNKQYGTQYILTFNQMLNYAKEKNMDVYFHLKSSRKSTFRPKNISTLLKRIESHGMKERTYVFSSNKKVNACLKKYPSFKTGNLCSRSDISDLKNFAKTAKNKNKSDFVIFKYIEGKTNNKSLVDYCHRLGLKVCFYNIISEEETASLQSLGTDWLMLNKPVFCN